MIYDLDGNPIYSHAMSIPSAGAPVLQLAIDCLPGYQFRADVVADIAVEARKQGDMAWTNIETTPIDLTPYASFREIFEVRLTVAVVTAIRRRAFSLRVRKP